MSTEEMKQDTQAGQNSQKKRERKRPVLVAIIGAIALIVVALTTLIWNIINNETKITITMVDAASKENIPGTVFFDDDKNPTQINQAKGTAVSLKKGSHTIRANSDGYRPNTITIDRVPESLEIKMEQVLKGPIPLSLVGSNAWDLRISRGAQDNEIIVNGNLADAGGFFKNGLVAVLRGKTLVLYFSNVSRSEFSLDRMVRLTYNISDTTLDPINASTSNGGYIPAGETPLDNGIEFPIPDDFDGKLGFVFYQANLRDLRITAYYK